MDINFVLLSIFALGWFWFDSTLVRERAINASRMACAQYRVQLLDQTVVLRKLRLHRQPHGLCLSRVYSFEFSANGESRDTGFLVMLGKEIGEVGLPPLD